MTEVSTRQKKKDLSVFPLIILLGMIIQIANIVCRNEYTLLMVKLWVGFSVVVGALAMFILQEQEKLKNERWEYYFMYFLGIFSVCTNLFVFGESWFGYFPYVLVCWFYFMYYFLLNREG